MRDGDWADGDGGCDATSPTESSRAGKALEVVLNEAGSQAFAPPCGPGDTQELYNLG